MADFDKALKCIPKDSWLHSWMESWPLAEPPRSYVLFSGLAMLGACLGRKVWFDLDVHRTYPILNLLLIGPSGIGKSTALRDMAMNRLVKPLPEDLRPQLITGKTTKEGLHEDLMANAHSIILASELSNLFSKEKYNEGQIPWFTDLMDLEPCRIRTKGGGNVNTTVEKPECAVMGGSTKTWLQDMLPQNAGEGGFLPRFLIVKEDHKAQRIADPKRYLTLKQHQKLEQDREIMAYEFSRLLRMTEGYIDFEDYEASDLYSHWYQTFQPDTGVLSPFAARAGAFIIRLALLVAVSRRHGSIDARDVVAGISLYNYTAEKLNEVVVPMTTQGKMLMKLLEIIGDTPKSDIQVRRAMRNICGARDTDKLLGDLLQSKEIVLEDGKFRKVNLG